HHLRPGRNHAVPGLDRHTSGPITAMVDHDCADASEGHAFSAGVAIMASETDSARAMRWRAMRWRAMPRISAGSNVA
ncbi:MAG TPA: hypothetical protein VMT69_03680, partial [Kineosporiaceae bacterium]|nr:hypothetical protein [Kineosporiaceae bacterium]